MHCEISAPFDGKKSECVYIKTSKELSKSFFGMKQPQNLKKKKKQVHPAENPGRIQDQFLDELCRYVLKATNKREKNLKLKAVELYSRLQRFCV